MSSSAISRQYTTLHPQPLEQDKFKTQIQTVKTAGRSRLERDAGEQKQL